MQASAQVVQTFAPTGTLRVAINLGNSVLAQRDRSELTGVSVDLARALATQLDLPLELIPFDAAGKVFAAIEAKRWDLAFLAIDPLRSEQIAFTSPYVLIEGAYLVRRDSAAQTSADVDQPGTRISVGTGSAYELYLSRHLKHAHLEKLATGEASLQFFLEHHLDATAGVRQVLEAWAARYAQLRVLDDSFMTIKQALGVPRGEKDKADVIAYLNTFIESKKADGTVAACLKRSGQTGAKVAPVAPIAL